MILSKSSLLISSLARKDASIPGLDCIRLEKDGTAIAASKNIVLAIEGVNTEATKNLPFENTAPLEVTITTETAQRIASAIGSDSTFGGRLEYTDVYDKGVKLCFNVCDDKNRKSTIEGTKVHYPWINWRAIFRHGARRDNKKVIINRARLDILLSVLKQIAPDKGGESPLYIEFTEDNYLIVRSVNYVTGQRIIAIVTNYFGTWPEYNAWELSIVKPLSRTPRT
jgi:hypothetical protein